MMKLIVTTAAACFILACNNDSTKSAEAKNDTTAKVEAASTTVDYPYKPDYTIDFKVGDANNSKLVLDFFKLWENNNIDAMKPMLADSVWIEGSNGEKIHGTADSIITLAKQIRSSMSKVEIKLDTWMPIHANDKNEDWVLVWERDYTTDSKGKVDSTRVHTYWQVKNNKIAGWSEFSQKMTPSPPMSKK